MTATSSTATSTKTDETKRINDMVIHEQNTQAAAEQIHGLIIELADAYERAVEAGMKQEDAYAVTRGRVADLMDIPELQAANFVRLVIFEVGRRHGEEVYTKEQMETIIIPRACGAVL